MISPSIMDYKWYVGNQGGEVRKKCARGAQDLTCVYSASIWYNRLEKRAMKKLNNSRKEVVLD